MAGSLFNRNFLVRALSGVVFVAVVVGAVLLSRWSFAALMLVVAVGCVWEFYGISTKSGAQPQRVLGVVITVLIVTLGVVWTERIWSFAALILVILILTFCTFIVEVYRRRTMPLLNVATTLLGAYYVAIPLLMFFLLAFFQGGVYRWEYQPEIILGYFAIVWANDTGAYLFGVSFGRHRLIERISPKKSWEGFFGGVAAAVAVAFGMSRIIDVSPDSWLVWAGLGLVVAVTGVFGDLVESMFKRAVDIKDSGSIMPGHGGWLDRFDALLLSVPFAFIYLLIFAL